MTAKIDMAIDHNGNIVHIEDAIRGGKYYCIYCKDRLTAAKGTKQTHHFRHYSKDSESEYCHLYSSVDGDYSVLYEEERLKNKHRFVINHKLELKLKFPKLSTESFVKMNKKDLYFKICVQDQTLFSASLNEKSNQSYLDIKLAENYKISYKNKENAKLLNYDLINEMLLFEETTLLFKRIAGEYINIPYDKTSLTEEFFILSRKELTFINNIEIKNQKLINKFYVYHLYVNEVNDQVITWFRRNTHYDILPNRKWLDLVYPNTFTYNDSVILIADEEVEMQVTPFSKNDRLLFTDERGYVNDLLFDEHGIIKIRLKNNYVYNFSLKHEIANELSVKRVEKLTFDGYLYDILVNEESSESFEYPKDEEIQLESEKKFYIYKNKGIPLDTKFYQGKLNNIIHFPYIGTIKPVVAISEADVTIFNNILNEKVWVPTPHNVFMDVFNLMINSNISNKRKYINALLSNYNKLPYKLLKELKGEK